MPAPRVPLPAVRDVVVHDERPGELVDLHRGSFGGNGLYRVARTEVTCSQKGLFTLLELGEPDSMI